MKTWTKVCKKGFINTFAVMLSRMCGKSPYCVTIAGDINCRTAKWLKHDIESGEGKLFELLSPDLGLRQVINESTHLIGNLRSCIDVIFIDQPNLFL